MNQQDYRIEQDSLGEIQVPATALWGAQTQRAIENFPISGLRMPQIFLRALGLIKAACAEANAQVGALDPGLAEAIREAALAVVRGDYDTQFPVDVFQTGSGTSTNMNANEVIAHLATDIAGRSVHPNDHVNLGQSSNDVIPSALHLAAALLVHERLLPALVHLEGVIRTRGDELRGVIKTGRTHLMDALPIRMDQELGGWAAQVAGAHRRIQLNSVEMRALALGGTAVGTGVNAPAGMAERAINWLCEQTGLALQITDNRFAAISAQDAAVNLSGALKSLAVALLKIANDLRWMNSGPLVGLAEIRLPTLQSGSSIMPGKVNPVIPEAVCQVAAKIIGNDASITIGGQSGNFQLNTMLPLIAHDLLQSLELAANAARLLADRAIAGFVVDQERISRALARNPILVTALNPIIGYEKAAQIAKRAYAENRLILEVAKEMTEIDEKALCQLLDPRALT